MRGDLRQKQTAVQSETLACPECTQGRKGRAQRAVCGTVWSGRGRIWETDMDGNDWLSLW